MVDRLLACIRAPAASRHILPPCEYQKALFTFHLAMYGVEPIYPHKVHSISPAKTATPVTDSRNGLPSLDKSKSTSSQPGIDFLFVAVSAHCHIAIMYARYLCQAHSVHVQTDPTLVIVSDGKSVPYPYLSPSYPIRN